MFILLAVSLIYLARSASFDVSPDGSTHTFPVYHGSHRLFKMQVPRVMEIIVIPTAALRLRDAGMIILPFLVWCKPGWDKNVLNVTF
jgi:hypothetical protein